MFEMYILNVLLMCIILLKSDLFGPEISHLLPKNFKRISKNSIWYIIPYSDKYC